MDMYQPPWTPMGYQGRPFNYSTNTKTIHVNGRGGVDALQMLPNSEVIVEDDTGPYVWKIVTDGAGYKTAYQFDVTPHVDPATISVQDLDTRLNRLEALLNELKPNVLKPAPAQPSSDADGVQQV